MRQSSMDSAETVDRDDLTIAETLPPYDTQTLPPDYTSRAPSIIEPPPEPRWTREPRERNERFRNNPHPEDYYVMGPALISIPEGTEQEDPPQNPVAEPPRISRRAFIETQLRVCSWLAALAGFSSTIYVSARIESLRTSAALCQLAALSPLCFDSWKIFVLLTEQLHTHPSHGKAWYFNLICAIGAGVGCWILWTTGEREGVFEPFGQAGAVTVAIALMATNG